MVREEDEKAEQTAWGVEAHHLPGYKSFASYYNFKTGRIAMVRTARSALKFAKKDAPAVDGWVSRPLRSNRMVGCGPHDPTDNTHLHVVRTTPLACDNTHLHVVLV